MGEQERSVIHSETPRQPENAHQRQRESHRLFESSSVEQDSPRNSENHQRQDGDREEETNLSVCQSQLASDVRYQGRVAEEEEVHVEGCQETGESITLGFDSSSP